MNLESKFKDYMLTPGYMEPGPERCVGMVSRRWIDRLVGYAKEKRIVDPNGNVLMISAYHVRRYKRSLRWWIDLCGYAQSKGVRIVIDYHKPVGFK